MTLKKIKTPWEEKALPGRFTADQRQEEIKWQDAFSKMHPLYLVGAPRHLSKSGAIRPHEGIDIYAELGTRIVSMFSGKVIFSGDIIGYGKCVIVKNKIGEHEYSVVYAHFNKTFVKKDTIVVAGQLIGTVGESGIMLRTGGEIPVTSLTGKSMTGPHLHLEILEDTDIEISNKRIRKWRKGSRKPTEEAYKKIGYFSNREEYKKTGIWNNWAEK